MTRIVVVTGSASGIGKATAEILVKHGTCVIGVDLHDAEINAGVGTTDGRQPAIRYGNPTSVAYV